MTTATKHYISALERENDRLRVQVKRWQAVAWVDGADVYERAEQEGVPLAQFIREFYRKPRRLSRTARSRAR